MVTESLQRYLVPAVAALLALLLGAFVLIAVLFVQLDRTRGDLARVEGGAVLYALQVERLGASLEASRPDFTARLDAAIAGLEGFRESTLEFRVAVDQPVEIRTDLELRRDVTVPVRTSLPIDQSFDTTIDVRGPLGVVVPVNVTVPIRLDVPVDLELTVPLDETIPLEATVPVRAEIPLAVDVTDTELAGLADALIEALVAFRDLFAGLGR